MNIESEIARIPFWWHSIPIGDYVTPGLTTPETHQQIADCIPEDLTGKTVLDVGAADGYYSFLAEQRGAKRVVAVDHLEFREGGKQGGHPVWAEQSNEGFKVAKRLLGSNVEFYIMDAHNLSILEGTFDVVFLFGVHYHFVDPILGFDSVCAKVGELLLLEGDAINFPVGAMLWDFNPEDGSRTWRLSDLLIRQMLLQRGFKAIVGCWSEPTALVAFETPIPDMYQKYEAYRTMWRCWK